MAIAHRGLGEDELAAADIATAENIYAQLGVEPAHVCGSSSPGGLTKREIEILTHIAGGATNKQVAEQICISEKTVGRHLANIYTKLGVSSRTAAVTWAYANNVITARSYYIICTTWSGPKTHRLPDSVAELRA